SATGLRAGSNCALSAATAAISAAVGVLPEDTGWLVSATGAFCSEVSSGCTFSTGGGGWLQPATAMANTNGATPNSLFIGLSSLHAMHELLHQRGDQEQQHACSQQRPEAE